MAFTLQPATKDDFINRESILNEMIFTITDVSTRMGFALVDPRRVGKTSIPREVGEMVRSFATNIGCNGKGQPFKEGP